MAPLNHKKETALDAADLRKDTTISKSTLQLTESTTFTMDDVLTKIGNFGRYQILLLLFGIIALMFWGSVTYALILYLLAEPKWECVRNSTVCNITGLVGPADKNYGYRCGIPRQDWKFSDEYTTLVTKFDLVCGNSVYVFYAFNIWIAGEIIGAFLSGYCSDRFGRKKMLFACGLLSCCVWLVISFSQHILMFIIPLFFIGVGYAGFPLLSFVLVIEYVGIKYRSRMGNGLWFSYGLGFLVFAGIGHLAPKWRTLNIIFVCCGVTVLLFYWFVPESLRWLVLKNRFKQASHTLKTIAKINKKVIKDDLKLPNFDKERKSTLSDAKYMFLSGHATTTLVVWYGWFSVALMYDGVHLSAPSVGGNIFFNWFLAAIAEICSTAACIPLHNRFGRKKCIVISEVMAAISAMVAVILTQYDDGSTGFFVGKILMSMVFAKFFITIAYNGIALSTAELFPTVVRSIAQGSSGACSRIGALASIYVTYLIRVHPLLPYGIMGVNALISGLLCLIFLKETNSKPILDTFQHEKEAHVNQGIETRF